MDDELKKFIEATAVQTRRHFEVVAERLEAKVAAIAEGVMAANERIDRFDAKVEGLASAIAQQFIDVR